MNSDSTLSLDEHSDSLIIEGLSIALIGPDEERRKAASTVLAKCQSSVIREFTTYPPSLSDLPKLLEQHYDVIVIDLDSRPEYALELVENVCAYGTATVMVYSMKADSDQLVRCMRAGAREFLTLPFVEKVVTDALVRAATRKPTTPPTPKKAGGRLMVFLGAKGGDGVTTLACNFAVSMAKESGQSTLLIDLDLPLGDAALNLGVVAEYSTINALQNAARLDSAFLSKLLVKHSSGVSVLAAPGKFPQFDASHDAIDKLISVARQDFDNVVIDMGSRLDLMGTSLFKDGSTIYLVIQAGIAGLRNSNRLISQYFATGVPKLEIVLNRFQSRTLGVAEDQIAKALTRPAQWKIPNDYAAVRRMQHTAVPLALEDSPISRLIRKMARSACGLPAIPEKGSTEKGSGFSLKNLGRSFTSKISSSEEPVAVSVPESAPNVEQDAAPASELPTGVRTSHATEDALSTAVADSQPATEMPPLSTSQNTSISDVVKEDDSAQTGAPALPSEPETRNYRGATYVKGADGKWYLQKAQISSESTAAGETAKPQIPVVAWSVPAPIIYGTKLGAAELNATASVPGSFVYIPAEGETLTVGEHTLTATFTPEDTNAFTAAEVTVALTVAKAVPIINWVDPATITYGVALDGSQLNATTSVPGEFVYTPAAGEVLAAGQHTLSVSFTPADAASYESVSATVQIIVNKAVVAITWAAPMPITYGMALDSSQLNATTSVPGEFVYTPAAGEVLTAGEHTLSVSFAPADAVSYEPASATVQIIVEKAIPAITWEAPAPIAYGAALSSYQLNATASVSGEFLYTPATGELLPAGTHNLSVSFKPLDANYLGAEATVPIVVTKATPIVLWPVPESITENTALSTDQLNATALVEGSFEYSPAAGEQLAPGTHILSVTFTPKNAEQFNNVQSSVLLTVTEVAKAIEASATTLAEESVEPISSSLDLSSEPSIDVEEESKAVAVEPEAPSDGTSAEAEHESEAALAVEPAGELVTEQAVESIVETVESVTEDASETLVEVEIATSVEIPVELVIETAIDAHVESVVEQPMATPDEMVSVEADTAAVIEVPAEPVPEPVDLATETTQVVAPALPEAESNVETVETEHEVPEQALVKIPPPKFTFEAGSGLNLMGTAVFPDGTTIYLVMQPGSGGHVDSQKLVSQFLSGGELKPEFVINRYEPLAYNNDDEQHEENIEQARELQGAPQMNATVQPAAAPEKKKSFLKGLRQSLWARVTASEKTEGFTQLGLKQKPETAGSTPFAPTAQVSVNSEVLASAAPLPGEGPQRTARSAEAAEVPPMEAQSAPVPQVETRTYQGATYVKGSDGKWHLQQPANRVVSRETQPAAPSTPAMAPLPQSESEAKGTTSAQTEPDLSILSTPTLSMETSAPVKSVEVEPPTADEVVAAEPVKEQAPVENPSPLKSYETAGLHSISVPEVVVEAEDQPEEVETAFEPPAERAGTITAKESILQIEEPIVDSTPAVKSSVKAKSVVKTTPKVSIKPAAKAKKSAKSQAKPAAKAKKTVKAPAKSVAKGKKPVKGLAKPASKTAAKSKKTVKPPVKATGKSKKAVKAPVKAVAKGKKPVKNLPKKVVKVAAKAKAPIRAGKKPPVKSAAKKTVKPPVKPAAKSKTPLRKQGKKR